MVKSGQVWTHIFYTRDGTGALATPSVGPTCTLYVNHVANVAVVAVAGTNNPYTWSVTLPTLAPGDCVDIGLTATIGGIATAGVIAQDVTELVAIDANGNVSLGAILGTALTESVVGYLAAGFKKLLDVAAPAFTLASANQTGDAYADAHSVVGKLTGITLLANWLRGLARKSAMDATAKTELNSGGGTYDEATDSQEAIRDTAPLGTAMRGTDGALLAISYTAPDNTGISNIETLLADIQGVGWTTETLVALQAAINAKLDASAYVAPPSASAISTQVNSDITAAHGAGPYGGAGGTGFYTVNIPCKVGGLPADGVEVRVTSDLAGLIIIAQTYSDTLGNAQVFLDAGSYYVWLERGGDTFINPTAITVP